MEINTAVRMMNVTIYKYGNLQIYGYCFYS